MFSRWKLWKKYFFLSLSFYLWFCKINEQQFTVESEKNIFNIWEMPNCNFVTLAQCDFCFFSLCSEGWRLTFYNSVNLRADWQASRHAKTFVSPSAQNIDERNGSLPSFLCVDVYDVGIVFGGEWFGIFWRRWCQWTSCFRSGCFLAPKFSRFGNFYLSA